MPFVSNCFIGIVASCNHIAVYLTWTVLGDFVLKSSDVR